MHYLIWSFKHGEWWRANRQGYTRHLSEAGRYSKGEAGHIVLNTGIPNENAGMPEVTGAWWQERMNEAAHQEEVEG
jgi:hypothetical protein